MRHFTRTLILLLGATAITGAFSCKKENTLEGFNMLFRQQFTIPPGIGQFDVHHFYLKNIQTKYQESLDLHQKKDADISSIITTQAKLTGLFGDADFKFIDQVSVRIYDESDPTDFLEIAYRQPVPLDPGNELALLPSLAGYKRFMTGSRFAIDVVFWLRNTTVLETDVQLDIEMKAVTGE